MLSKPSFINPYRLSAISSTPRFSSKFDFSPRAFKLDLDFSISATSCGPQIKSLIRVVLEARSSFRKTRFAIGKNPGIRLQRTRNVSKRHVLGAREVREAERVSSDSNGRGIGVGAEYEPLRARKENQQNGIRVGRDRERVYAFRECRGGGWLKGRKMLYGGCGKHE